MWPRIASVLVFGYFSLSRTFAYLGVPAWKVFVGEVVLGLLLVCGPRIKNHRWLSVSFRLPSLKRFLTWYSLFLAYGIIQVFRGIGEGNPPLVTLRDLAFNYYPLYFFLGLWAGLKRPDLLPRLVRWFAWFNGIYGVLFILYFGRLDWSLPGVGTEVAPVPVFPQPIYSFVALLGLLAYEKSVRRSWYLLLLNGFVILGMQFRTEWLAFAVGVVTWAVITRQGKRLMQASLVGALLIGAMYVSDLSIPGLEGRGGGNIAVAQLVERGAAPFHADVRDASAITSAVRDTEEATFVWRTVWWLAIWDSVHSDFRTMVWGHGYGFALGDLVPYLEGEFIRTPHNEFFYALGYTGWIGVMIYAFFQIGIFRLLWDAQRRDGEPFGIIFWVAMMAFSMFFPLGETPYGAIPFYLIVGWCIAPMFGQKGLVLRQLQSREAIHG